MRYLLCLTTALALSITAQASNNILLIIADDYGLDASTLYNSSSGVSLAPTPNIASLASNGVKFTNAYSYTVCSPARSSILTGRYGFRTGTANVVGGIASNNALKAAEFTLPEAFAANSGLNYQLKHIGKWHLGGASTAPCLIGGWPSFSGALIGEIEDYVSWTKIVGSGSTTSSSTSTTYATTDNVNDALTFINAQTTAGKPWFTWLAFNAPHIPYHLPSPTSLCPHYTSLSGTAQDIAANPLNYYNAAIEAMDTEIGRLLAGVDFNTTTVIFIGDNGTPPATLQSPYPANKGKASLYEGGIRVPMIIRGAGVVSPGRTSTVLTHVVDLYSTILELAGVNVATTVPQGTTLDSQSLVPVLQNQTVTRPRVFGDYWDLAFPTLTDSGRVLRDSQYKLVRPKTGTDRFYDLTTDPYEANNLIAGGVGSMTTGQQTAYNSLVTQLGSYNTPPTISAVANQSVALNTSTPAIPFTIGDAELSTSILTVSAISSNTTLVPSANIVVGGSGASRTATISPTAGQNGTTTITLTVTDGVFSTDSSFVLSVGTPIAVSSVANSPVSPTNTDTVNVTANVAPGAGNTLTSVQLSYNSGAQITSNAFQEIFANASTAGGVNGAMNTWTGTTVRAPGDVKQRSGTANHTVPIILTNCTTNGTTTVTCASTAGLIPGMSVSGTTIAGTATISQVKDATTFIMNTAAIGSSSGLSLTAAGLTLTGCSVSGTTITCASTAGLSIGMVVSGTGLVTSPPNTAVTVATIPTSTTFTFTTTVTTCPTSLTASGCGLELSNGTANYSDTMATSSPINAGSASAGYVEFYVRTSDLVSNHGWTFQVSPDGGGTWNTRLSESFASGPMSSCTLNSSNNQTSGSTTVLCSNTSDLAVDATLQGAAVQIANCITSSTTTPNTVFTANTSALAVGMFVAGPGGSGIANGSRITAINPGVSFTMSTNATVTNASPGITLTSNFLPANATVSSIVPNTSFVISSAAFYSGAVSLINHSFLLKHYDLTAAELKSNMQMRFQWSGGTATAPAKAPTCDIDDIVVVLTTGAAPVTISMVDDGAHGDGIAGDGIYGATIPIQAAGKTISYTITATDSAAGTASAGGSYLVSTAAPVLAVTPGSGLSSAGAAGSSLFTPTNTTYTLTNNGTGTMTWTAAKTSTWLNLSSFGGTLAAGASTTVTASINTVNANALSAATYGDTITFTNTNTGTGNTSRSVSLLISNGTPTAPSAPVLGALSSFSSGTSKSLSWPGVANATSYTIQIATDSGFTTSVVSQTVANPSATFTNLFNGVTYYYRVLASNSVGSSTYGNTVSSTQDTGAPTVAIATPTSGTSTSANSITVTGTSSDSLSGIGGVKVNNVAATSSNGFATWTATVPLAFGTNGISATATDGAGNIATSDATLVTDTTWQTYNPLAIPDVMVGTTFNLTLSQKSKQFPNLGTNLSTNTTAPSSLGSATTTLGYNAALMWGPTLIMNQGDTVQINVTNNVPVDTTTVHWHGFHIPAIMDGGPHQTIPTGTTWSPTFTVKNNAATYWYHPHLHTTTQKQLTQGAGGFIIVRDPQESALALPRTYGVDDIPLAITSRRFIAANEFGANQYTQVDGTTSTLDNYGDFILVNGTPTNVTINGSGAGATATLYPPQVNLPKQYVRLRILNAEIQRGYNLGFSDNRTFYVITNDQGLLNAPVAVTRMFLMVGERVEILVNLGSDTIGSSFDLKAYNSGQVFGFPGNEGNPKLPTGVSGGENGSLLNNTDFSLLHINVSATTSNPITSLPATLANNTYWTNGDVTNTRTIAITGGSGGTPGFKFDSIGYTPTLFNHTINYNAVEKWTVSAGNVFSHALHIHDVKFNIIARSGGTQVSSNGLAAPYESGWKDTVYIPKGETVSVIAKYDDFASNTNPFMFHCHFLNHEDGGMMGQFVVVNNAVEDLAVASFTRVGSNNQISLDFKATVGTTYNLQYSSDLSNWTTIGSVTSNGTSANFTETDATRLSNPKGFYRVMIPTVP